MSKTIEEILAPKPEARPRIYAYSIDDQAQAGLLKGADDAGRANVKISNIQHRIVNLQYCYSNRSRHT